MYRNIIFDLGGVMFEWAPEKLVRERNLPLGFSDIVTSPLWLAHDGGFVSREEVIEKSSFSEKERTKLQEFLGSLHRYLRPIPEMHALLQEVRDKGYKVYILSNMPQEMQRELSGIHDFMKKVDGAVYSYQVKCIKPMEKIYQHLLSTYQLEPKECLFIDDLEMNVLAAKAQGMGGIVFKNPFQVREELKNLNVVD